MLDKMPVGGKVFLAGILLALFGSAVELLVGNGSLGAALAAVFAGGAGFLVGRKSR